MRKGTKKALIITGSTIGGLIVVIVVAGAFLVTTQTGLKFILAHAGGKVHVGSVKGSLVGPFTLRDVTLDTDSAKVHVDRLNAHWKPGALLSGTLDIQQLTLAGIDVWRHPSTEPTTSSGPPKLKPPISVNIDKLELKNARVHGAKKNSKPFVIKSAALSGKFTKHNLNVRHIEAHGPLFDIAGGAEVAPGGDYSTQGKIQFALRMPDYAPATGRLDLDGTLHALKIVASVASPYNARATLHADALATPVAMRAQAKLDGMHLHAVHAAWPSIALTSTARAKGTAKKLAYSLRSALKGGKIGTLDIALDGSWTKPVAKIEKLAITRPDSPMKLTATGQADTGGASPKLALDLNWQALGWPLNGAPKVTIPHGEAHVNGTLKKLDARFQTAFGEHGKIQGTAQRHGERIAVNANWSKLRFPANGRVSSPSGTLNFGGTLNDYTLKVDAKMSAPKQTHGHLIVRGAGNKRSINIRRIDLKALQGELQGRAQAKWKPALSGQVTLTGKGINPGLVASGWPGRLGLKLKAGGGRQNGELAAKIDTFRINGKLRGYPVALNLVADYRDKVLALRTLSLKSGGSQINAHGHISQTLDLHWKIASDDLDSLYPGAHGKLDGHGSVKGARKQPHAIAKLNGSGIAMALKGKAYSFQRLDADADVNLQANAKSHIDVELAGGKAGDITIESVKLKGNGTRADHHLTLTAKTTRGGADLAVNGAFKGKRWDFKLIRATLSYPKLAPWKLTAPASGYVGKQAFALDQTCWTSKDAKACVHAHRDADKLTGVFNLNNLRFAYFKALMPPTVGITGSLDAKGDFARAGAKSQPVVHLTATTTAGEILAKTPPEQGGQSGAAPATHVVGLEPSHVKMNLDDTGLRLDAGLMLENHGGLVMQASIPGGRAPLTQRKLTGELRADIHDLGFIARFKPTLGKIGGRLKGDMHVKGTLAAPVLLGRIALENGSAELPGPGLKLKNIQLALNGEPDGNVKISGGLESGGGKLSIDGTANVTHKPSQANITIKGDNFQALDNEQFGQVWISPDMKVALNGNTINVSGLVKVPKANLTPKNIPQSAVKVSGDQVIVKPGKKHVAKVARNLNVAIHLILGKEVHFKGFGLKSDIAGDLKINEQGASPPTANGSLHLVNGEYRAYGQGLVIQEGTLLFAGPVTEPGLDVRAVRHPAEDVTVGVSISGTLKNPKFELFSEPPMTQEETLSWLVLGRPLNDTSDQQGSALSRLALGLGINQSNKIAKNLGKGLGLDTFSIETGSSEAGSAQNVNEAALVLGKYLTPRLYVSYGIGLFRPVNTLRLAYTLSSRWKLATESSKIASGGDLIYNLDVQ